MTTLEIKNITISKGYENECFFIDGIPFQDYMKKWYWKNDNGIPQPLAPFDDLAVTWTAGFDNDGDARFMKWLLGKDKLNLPILSCPDDLDFSCIVIVADTEKTDDHVLWKRIGMVNHSAEDKEQAKEHGIVFSDNFTDEDWEKYMDAALMRVGSHEWNEWISENWSEELYRRHINYTYPYYQDDRNIDWICDCSWCFDRKEYDVLAASCRPHWCMDKGV